MHMNDTSVHATRVMIHELLEVSTYCLFKHPLVIGIRDVPNGKQNLLGTRKFFSFPLDLSHQI